MADEKRDPPPLAADESAKPEQHTAPGVSRFSPRPRPWVLPVGVGILAIAAVMKYSLGQGSLDLSSATSTTLLLRMNHTAYSIVTYVMPGVLLAVVLFHLRRLAALGWMLITLAVVHCVLVGAVYIFGIRELTIGGIPSRDLITLSDMAAIILIIVTITMLPLLSKRGRILQVTAASVVAACLAFDSAYVYTALHDHVAAWTVNVLLAIGMLVGLGLLLGVLYAAIFHPMPVRTEAPADAAAHVSLQCPRCRGAIEVVTNGGSCPHCRLSIFIALEEGRCRHCRYALRGLTGDRCPECGKPVVPPSADADLLAWAAANDAVRR